MLYLPNLIPVSICICIIPCNIPTTLLDIFQPLAFDIAFTALFWGKIQFMWNFLEREKAGHTLRYTQTYRTVEVEDMFTHSTLSEINTNVKNIMWSSLYITVGFYC